jgi:lipocalin-like protein
MGVTADYSLRRDGSINVVNRCRKRGGRVDEAYGRAKVVDRATNAKLKVSFFGPFYARYWVLDHADDYSWSIVGEPSGRQAVPSLVAVPAQTAAKARASSHTLLGFSAETDSPLEQAGFEPLVPLENWCHPAVQMTLDPCHTFATAALSRRYDKFESLPSSEEYASIGPRLTDGTGSSMHQHAQASLRPGRMPDLPGTEISNPPSSSGESIANLTSSERGTPERGAATRASAG